MHAMWKEYICELVKDTGSVSYTIDDLFPVISNFFHFLFSILLIFKL